MKPVNIIAEFLESFSMPTTATGLDYKTWCLSKAWELHRLLEGEYVGEFHTPTLLKAAEIARESYPQNSEYDVLMKIAAGSIAGTLERMAHSPISPNEEKK